MKTPFGEVLVEVTDAAGKKVEADMWIIKVENDARFQVDGRFLIEVCILPEAGKEYVFTCFFQPSLEVTDSGVETGESLELKSWYHHLFKWSIGTVDEDWLLSLRHADCREAVYSDSGISLRIGGMTLRKPFMLPFAIAWKQLDDKLEEDVYTWFAACPADMYVPKWME